MRIALVIGFGALVLSACSSKNGATPDAADNCTGDPRAEVFTVGLEHMGDMGNLDFKLMSIDPAPVARGNNTWVLEVDSMTNGVVGAPVANVTFNKIFPYMPDHGHGTPITASATAGATAGQYTLQPLNFWMPGLWTTTLQVTAGTVKDSTTYKFCVPI